MIEGYYDLKNDMAEFENVIRNLSIGVNDSGISWRDAQYQQLAYKIGVLAASSKGVIQAGQRCKNAMERFDSIVSEV